MSWKVTCKVKVDYEFDMLSRTRWSLVDAEAMHLGRYAKD